MIKILYIFILIFVPVIFTEAQETGELYNRLCSGCHGLNLEGTTSGGALNKIVSKYGPGSDSIFQAIKKGIPGTTMIAWEDLLTERQIRDLTNYIINAAEKSESKNRSDHIEIIDTETYRLKIDHFSSGILTTPWSIEFVNRDTAIVSEKHGSLKLMIHGMVDTLSILGLPEPFLQSGTAGYMDIALDPEYDQNRWIYLSFSHAEGDLLDKDTPGMTKIVRGRIEGNRWVDEQVLFEAPESLTVVGGDRWGCRFLFDREGYLYFSIGDMGQAMDSQDPGKPTGKIFRIHPDGTIPDDNPFVDDIDAIPSLYSTGNRNVQGIDQHPVTGEIWATEHGPRGGDELNIIKGGRNYGWPVITYGINYDGTIITERKHQEGMEQPAVYWTPSIAVCPAQFCSSTRFPLWNNNLFVGALAFHEVRRLIIEDDEVTHQEVLIKGMGRIRDLKFGPDGALYLVTNNPDRILRITVL